MKPLDEDPCHAWDKIGLFILAGMVVAVLGLIVYGSFWGPDEKEINEGLLGTVGAGLLLYGRDIVGAVRSSWEEVTRSKTNDQLAAGRPSDVAVAADAKEAAEQVAEAAEAEAETIKKARTAK